jgi:hypothetical protein
MIVKLRILVFAFAASVTVLSSPAMGAGGHYAVDDAVLVDPGRCLIEAWHARADRNNTDYTVLPACNPAGKLELGMGLSRIQEAGDYDTQVEFYAKTVAREVQLGSYGWGVAVSSTWGGALQRSESAAAYVPLSVHLIEPLLLHFNAGWADERGADHAAIWGSGADYSLAPRVNLIAEIYGTHRGGTELQAGLRYSAGAGVVDLSYGRARATGRDDWVTVGVGWNF